MKQFVTVVCILHLFACAAINRPHTRATIAFEKIANECTNLDIIVLDDNSVPLPGISVSIHSAVDKSLIWQGATGMDGHIQQEVTVNDIIVTAQLDGFYSHEELINIPQGKKCLLLIYTKPDPNLFLK